MTLPAGSLTIVRLGAHQIATIPLINHPSRSLLEEGHRHPVHPPHFESRSFQTVQQASIQTLFPTTAQTTTMANGYGSNVPHHPPHPSPTSQLASSKLLKGTFIALHRDHICEATQSWELKRRRSATVVVQRQKLYSREAQQRRLVEGCAGPPPPSTSQTMLNPPSPSNSQSRLAVLIGGLLRRLVGLRLRKTLRRLLNRLYWRPMRGIRITRKTPKARRRIGSTQTLRASIRQPQNPNKSRPTRPRPLFLSVLAYPFSSESLEYATQLDAFSHAYN